MSVLTLSHRPPGACVNAHHGFMLPSFRGGRFGPYVLRVH